MRHVSTLVAVLLVTAGALSAQVPPDSARRRFQPLPDHWMTIDSLGQALGLSAAERTKITPAYTALNGVMKDAAARRQEIRQRMQTSGFVPGQEPTPEMRARMDSVRIEMEGFQAEADQWYTAIRNNLTPVQQAKFDGLPKPVVFRQRGAMGGPPGGPPPQ